MSRGRVFVYVMAHLVDGSVVAPCKVGISWSPRVRLDSVRRDEGHSVVIVAAFPFASRIRARFVEAEFHRRLAPYRLHGEWFDLSVADAIANVGLAINAFVDRVECAGQTPERWLDAMARSRPPGHGQSLTEDDFFPGSGPPVRWQ